ncbi:MAG: M28 family peptidase, partial [Anaerovoracaceae bacterium]
LSNDSALGNVVALVEWDIATSGPLTDAKKSDVQTKLDTLITDLKSKNANVKAVIIASETSTRPVKGIVLSTHASVPVFSTTYQMFQRIKENKSRVEKIYYQSQTEATPVKNQEIVTNFAVGYTPVENPEMIIHITGHYDGVGLGTNTDDNGSGAANILAMAEEFATKVVKDGKTLKQLAEAAKIEVRFIGTGGEEYGMPWYPGAYGYVFGKSDYPTHGIDSNGATTDQFGPNSGGMTDSFRTVKLDNVTETTNWTNGENEWPGISDKEKAISVDLNVDMVGTSWPTSTAIGINTMPINIPTDASLAQTENSPELNYANKIFLEAAEEMFGTTPAQNQFKASDNVRTAHWSGNDKQIFAYAGIDAAGLTRRDDFSNAQQPGYHLVGDNMSMISEDRLMDAYKLHFNSIKYAVDKSLSKIAKVAIDGSNNLTITNLTTLEKVFDSLTVKVYPADMSGPMTYTFKTGGTTAQTIAAEYSKITVTGNLKADTNHKYTQNRTGVSQLAVEMPAIKTQPADKQVANAATAAFTVTEMSGHGPYTYKWQSKTSATTGSWTDIVADGTSATYTKTAATADSGMLFRCVVTDSDAHKATTYPAELTVTALSLTTQPTSISKIKGEAANFTVATGAATPTYQWQSRPNADTKWADISTNGTSDTYAIAAAALADNGTEFRCKVTSATDHIYSDSAKLTVKSGLITDAVSPVSAPAVEAGQTTTFVAKAKSATSEDLTFKWQVGLGRNAATWSDGSSSAAPSNRYHIGYVDLPSDVGTVVTAKDDGTGLWTSTLTTDAKLASYPATVSDRGQQRYYRCIIEDGQGRQFVTNATNDAEQTMFKGNGLTSISGATFDVKLGLTIRDSKQPLEAQTVAEGQNANFTVAVRGEDADEVHYQWQKATYMPGSITSETEGWVRDRVGLLFMQFKDIKGATSATYAPKIVKPLSQYDNAYYR